MQSTFRLKEPFKIDETYDQVEVYYALLGRADNTTDVTKRKLDYLLWPCRDEGGKRVYAPSQFTIRGTIADLGVTQTDPLLEDLRQKAVQADGVLIMGFGVLKGAPAA